MGGTKNREEKKKKAHVYSSGAAGGGNKGPAVVDKRNQTLECPHCDRTFQQIQRYREHITKKHAEEVQESNDAASNSNLAGDASTGPAQGTKMMQPGSKGGYYTDKSPMLLLIEWCQQQKRAKPRYKDLPIAGGLHTCRVVLPDPKGGDKDTVVFLDEAQAAPTPGEAQERGAVAALARVAGHRNMQRVLPKAYQTAWEWCVKQEEDAAARRTRAAAAAEQRKEREAGRRRALAMKAPATAVMTQQQRGRVEEVLAQLRQAQVSSAALPGDHDAVTQELVRLGFTEMDAETAVQGVGPPSLPACLDWLCLHLPEEDLPPAFAPGAAGEPVGVLLSGKAGAAHEALQDPAVAGLAQFGYPVSACMEALQRLKGDPDAAHQDLFGRLTGIEATEPTEEECEEWGNEVAALQAVYENMVEILSSGSMCFKTALPKDEKAMVFLQLKQGRQYPEQCPQVSVRCQQLTGRQVLYLTSQVSEAGKQEAGQGMLHILIDAFTQALDSLPASPPNPSLAPPPVSGPKLHAQQASQATNGSVKNTEAMPSTAVGAKRVQHRPRQSAEQVRAESQQLLRQQRALESESRHESMRQARKKLPAFGKRDELLAQLRQQSVLIISGATGCGKSTQIPQFILEEAIQAGQGVACNCICTQPRRISAVGVSTRVAQERGEGVGYVIGYSVRLESRTSARTRLLFCTTGILLRRFVSDPELEGVSHVIVDEVHERSLDTDLLLLLLRDLLAKGSPLKVILMSATADADAFAAYFREGNKAGKVGMLSVPGLTHPVRDLYLEDVLERTQFRIGPQSKWARKRGPKAGPELAAQPGQPAEDWQQAQHSEVTRRSLAAVDETLLNYDLLEALVVHIVQQQSTHGPAAMLQDWDDAPKLAAVRPDAQAILIFMPGAPEISRLVRVLEGSPRLRQASQGRLKVLPLHGALPSHAQVKVFEKVPAGVRKIVVATNVAETSITIDDVGCVIDTGKVKAMSYDAERGISRLAEGWVSLAAAQQRRGRAGRVQPGACFKLFSHHQASLMQREQAPEVARTPLEQLCLTVKTRFGPSYKLSELLGRMLTPPPVSAVTSAVTGLTRLGGLDQDEALTPLGRLLTQIPMDPRLAKTCIFACMLRCVDPILTIVAAMAHGRSVFVSPPDKRAEAAAARRSLTAGTAAVKSDHLAIIAAFNAWTAALAKGGRQHAHAFCAQMFLSEAALEAVQAGRADFAATLTEIGLLPASYQAQLQHYQPAAGSQELHAFDHFCNNARVIKAALCAGFYPSILRVDHPAARYTEMHSGTFEKDADPSKLRFFDKLKGRVFIHPGSINFDVGKFESGWMVYTDIVDTSKLYVRESSAVPIYALLLFGGKITTQHEEGTLKLDGWATFKAPARIAVLIRELRLQVDQLMLAKVADTHMNMFDSPITAVMQDLLAKDGF